jgi:hypothetical protein
MTDAVSSEQRLDPDEQTTVEALLVDAYDIDVTTLEKGQVIPVHEVVRIIGVPFEHRRYNLEMMRLREYIMLERMRLQRPISVKSERGALIINTDAQASLYHHKLAMAKIASFYKQTAYLASFVNPTLLTDEERRAHDARLTNLGIRRSALVRVEQSRVANGRSGESLVHSE